MYIRFNLQTYDYSPTFVLTVFAMYFQVTKALSYYMHGVTLGCARDDALHFGFSCTCVNYRLTFPELVFCKRFNLWGPMFCSTGCF